MALLAFAMKELREDRFNSTLLMAISTLFDPRVPLYTNCSLLTESDLLKMQSWRHSLDVGDYVDSLVEQAGTQVGWASACIKVVAGDDLTL